MGTNPSKFQGLLRPQAKNYPVETISWFDAISFCNRLSDVEGLSAYYRVRGIDVQIAGGDGYRLATEAEWEYACRAESRQFWSWGNDEAEASKYAWTHGMGFRQGPSPVGARKRNNFGLYDMHGNVWEWCWDYYDRHYYRVSPECDPMGPIDGERRTIRGGSWKMAAYDARCAVRDSRDANSKSHDVGFRIARSSNAV